MRADEVVYADYANLTEAQMNTLRSLGIRTDFLGGSINAAEIINAFSKKVVEMQKEINTLKELVKEVNLLKETTRKLAEKQ
ncbi:MAG TPA: hypothetical protein VEC36_04425 [Patescibacteria group bacterium]|nr:hypothetical protein [Patescibacteria group bacterium]